MALDLQVYTPSPDGFGSGSYSSVYESQRSAIITLQRDIFSGDNLRIESKRSDMDTQLQKIRPVRLYADSTKIFDGLILDPNYRFKSNNKNNFRAVAVGWDKEFSNIIISAGDNGNYSSQTINYIYADLCRIANNYGITKKAIYAYDASKLPYYDSGVFGTTLTVDFTGQTVWSAMQKLTQFLDIYETTHIGEWAVKIDALQSEFYIYIIPQMVNTDQTPTKTYKNFQLAAGKSLVPDYSRLLNYCDVYGAGGLSSQMLRTVIESITGTLTFTNGSAAVTGSGTHFNTDISAGDFIELDVDSILCQVSSITDDTHLTLSANYSGTGGTGYGTRLDHTTEILTPTSIPTGTETFYATNQPSQRRYLRLTISNPTGSGKTGNIMINGGDGATPTPNEIHERFYLPVGAGTTRYHFTNNRFATLSGGASYAFEVNSFSGCTLTVEECTLAIAGKSINDYGTKAKPLTKNDILTQDDINAYAIQQVRMYHAPLVRASFDLMPSWIDYTDLIGKTVRIYDELADVDTDFFCTGQQYKFQGKSIHESLALQRYNVDWEYSD